MRVWAILKKTVKEMLRDRLTIVFGLVFPIMLIVVFGAAFGSFTGNENTYEIAVINLDEGFTYDNATVNHGENVLTYLNEMKYVGQTGENTSTNVFSLKRGIDEEEAQKMVEDQDISAYVVIPRNFSRAVQSEMSRYIRSAVMAGAQEWLREMGDINYSDPEAVSAIVEELFQNLSSAGVDFTEPMPGLENTTATVTVNGDPGRAAFFTVNGIMDTVLRNYINRVSQEGLVEAEPYLPFNVDASVQDPYVIVENKALAAKDFTEFDYHVPGVMVFALLISSITVSIYLSREESNGTLVRLKLTKMRSFDLLLGTIIPYTVLSIIQLFVLVGVAVLIGYNLNPDMNYFVLMLVAVLGCLASVALGLILASVVKNEEQAGTLSAAVVIPISFLIGAWLPLPSIRLTDDFFGTGKSFNLFDWLPWTQCYRALSKTMTFGADLSDVAFELVLMVVLTALLFALGVAIYHGSRLRSG